MTALPLTHAPELSDSPTPDGLGGLLAGEDQRPLPLQAVKVRTELLGGLARSRVEQRFSNPHNTPLEAIHIFPLPERGAVVAVVLRAGDTEVRAECQERKQAEATYAAAKAQGHRAALLTHERDDVHTLRVTHLPPNTEVRVEIVVEELLKVEDGEYIWRFPTVVAPRYTPGDAVGHSGPGVLPDTDVVSDASRLTPPLRLAGGTQLDLEVVVRGPVHGVRSGLHAVSLGLEDGSIRVAPSTQATLDRDFVLAVRLGDADATAPQAWTDGTHTLLQLSPPAVALPAPLPRDAVFVVDISGSMGGTKMAAAKLALKTALHGLLPQDRFLLIAFDDRVEHFKTRFVAVSDGSLAEADRFVDQLRARGGTVMAPALAAALTPPAVAGRQRSVLFITDGQSTDEARLLQLAWQRKGAARIFPLGIDTAVNGALLERLARIGGGACTLCTPSDDVEAVVARLEARFGAPLLDGVTISGATPAQVPVPAVFSGQPGSVMLEGGGPLELSGTTPSGAWSATVTPKPAPFSLGASWARARVAALEDRLVVKPFEEEALLPELTRVALAHSVVSRVTAFVAVDRSVQTDGEAVTVVQPVELPHKWKAPQRVRAMSARLPAAPPPLMDAMAAGGAPPRPKKARGRALRRSAQEQKKGIGQALWGRLTGADAPAPAPKPAAAPPVQNDQPEAFYDGEESLADEMPIMAAMEPAPAAAPLRRRASAPTPAASGVARLAHTQRADGSFGGNVTDTLVALLTLLAAGHTRRRGLRKRVVQKAAAWLAAHTDDARVAAALALLEATEQSQDTDWDSVLELMGPDAARVLQ